MKLSELKKMVAEEYSRYLTEQETPPMPGGAPMPPTGGPAISGADDDIQMGEDPEEMLRNIYDMLKGHFEAEDMASIPPVVGGPAIPPMPDAPEDDMADVEVDDDEEEDEELEEAYGEKTGGNAARTSGKYGGAYGASGEDKGNAQLHEGVKSRLQKLANIKG